MAYGQGVLEVVANPYVTLLGPPESSERRLNLADLKDDPKLIAEYKRRHEKIWPEITQSIRGSGIVDMKIYLFGTRMFMVMKSMRNSHSRRKPLPIG